MIWFIQGMFTKFSHKRVFWGFLLWFFFSNKSDRKKYVNSHYTPSTLTIGWEGNFSKACRISSTSLLINLLFLSKFITKPSPLPINYPRLIVMRFKQVKSIKSWSIPRQAAIVILLHSLSKDQQDHYFLFT